jgi:predicted GTPase
VSPKRSASSAPEAERAALEGAISDFESALNAVPDAPADEMIRDAMRRLVEVAHRHETLLERILVDPQFANSTAIMMMTTRLLTSANGLLSRVKATGQLRPLSDMIVARTLVAFLMGFIASERAMPQLAQVAMRLFPQKAWIDGMTDVMIYGLLEDEKR